MNIETDLQTHIRELHAILAHIAPQASGLFKAMITINVADVATPLLLVGNAHASCEDGGCIAVLNPSIKLIAEVESGVAYSPAILKKIVSGRCDQMVNFWFDHYKNPDKQVTVLCSYRAKQPRPVEASAKNI